LNERTESLKKLLDKLESQAIGLPVQILVEGDNGEMSIGAKRNKLLFAAKGDYVSYVDDDDMVSDDYIPAILSALETKPDCVGIEGMMHTNLGIAKFKHSIEFQGWYTGADAYYRTPNHLNPIKKSIAQSIAFPDQMFGEDQRFSEALRRALRTEVYIDHPIYFYYFTKELFPA
jgi:cellulose synthase/poly-beta-1,6-N-acetylglucosamine synthase-like glycosyltransferase